MHPAPSNMKAKVKPVAPTDAVATSPISVTSGDALLSPKQRAERGDAERGISPLALANWFSVMSYSWLSPLLELGSRRPLLESDIPDIPSADAPRSSVPVFEEFWRLELAQPDYDRSLLRALRRGFGSKWFLGGFVHFMSGMMSLGQPYAIKALLGFLEPDDDSGTLTGFIYAGGLVVATLGVSLSVSYTFYLLTRQGAIIRSTLMAVVYDKALRLSSAAKQSSSIGQTVNLMSTDSHRVFEGFLFSHFLWMSPLMIAIVLALLWTEIGVGAIAGVGLMLLMIPVQGVMARRIGRLRRSMLEKSDQRINLMSELLNGVRVVKFYAWELPLSARVSDLRRQEVEKLRDLLVTKSVNLSMVFVWPIVTSLAMFFTYTQTGHELTVKVVFTVLALMNALRYPIALLPHSVAAAGEGRVSLQRIQTFLLLEELQEHPALGTELGSPGPSSLDIALSAIEASEDGPGHASMAVEAVDCEFCWEPGVPVLCNISLHVPEGALIGIVGLVGAGKSSLLSGLLGQMHMSRGHVNLQGALSYTAQQNWIQNASLRDNVLFGLPFDAQRFQEAIEAAALLPDIAMLPAGVDTEIGERGVNLSGGQKARTSMARALYRAQQSDLFLFDDPFSAVDVGVAKHMFQRCLRDVLKGKTRIVVLNSHLHFLKHFDHVYVVGQPGVDVAPDGGVDACSTILDHGTYADVRLRHASLLASVVEQSKEQEKNRVSRSLSRDRERSRTRSPSAERVSFEQVELDVAEEKSENHLIAKTLGEKDGYAQKAGQRQGTVQGHEEQKAVARLIEQEDRKKGSVEWSVYRAYFRAVGVDLSCGVCDQGTATIVIILAAFVVGQAGRVLADWWLAIWSEGEVFREESTGFWLTYYGVIVGVTFVLVLWRMYLFVLVSLRACISLHTSLFRSLLRAPTSWYDVTPIGRITNRFSKDLDQVDVLLPDFLGMFLQNALHLVAALLMCCITTYYFAVLALGLCYIFFRVQDHFRLSSRELKRLEGTTRSPIFSSFSETLNGLATIRAFRMTEVFRAQNRSLVVAHARAFLASMMTARWLAIRLDMVSLGVVASVAVLGVLLKGTVDISLVGLSLIYALQFTGLLQWTVRISIETENNMTAVERLIHYSTIPREAAYFAQPPDAASSNEVLDHHFSAAEAIKPGWPAVKPVSPQWPTEGAIQFRHAALRYRADLPLVLRDITCTVRPREKIGIVGRTGAGKSSIMLALFRMVEMEQPGSIFIDGQDIAAVALYDLRSRMSIIPQDPVIFSGTIRSNVDPLELCSEEEVWQALERVNLKALVQSFPGGLQHAVAEGGDNLSHGQRQLLCIARALTRRSKIILLDEATSSVDQETDQLIQESIRKNFADCTVLTIAHRLDTILDSTRVMVVDAGRVAEFGPPAELLRSKGIFAAMVEKMQNTKRGRERTRKSA